MSSDVSLFGDGSKLLIKTVKQKGESKRRDFPRYLIRLPGSRGEILGVYSLYTIKNFQRRHIKVIGKLIPIKQKTAMNCGSFFYNALWLTHKMWCLGTGLNCPHEDFQSSALPTELPRQREVSLYVTLSVMASFLLSISI